MKFMIVYGAIYDVCCVLGRIPSLSQQAPC